MEDCRGARTGILSVITVLRMFDFPASRRYLKMEKLGCGSAALGSLW